jgi:WD40 repeat protein
VQQAHLWLTRARRSHRPSRSYDFGVRLYDFAGMKRDLRPFRELEPCGAHQIRAVSWSPTGEAFLVVAGSAEPKIIDRDGRELGFFVRGDMYIRDARHTRGHIMGCTSGAWHPRDKSSVLTASEDGTLRLWDVTYVNKEGGAAGAKCQTAVIKPVGSKPGRLGVSACAWSPDGSMIAGGISDGSIQLWSSKSNFASAAVGQVMPPKAQLHLQQHWTYATRPVGTAKGAHAPGEDGVTALRFRRDNVTLASRASDGTLKLWDVRKLSAPLRVVEGLPTSCPQAGLTFSPDEGLVVTTLSEAREGASGGLAFFETATLKLIRRLGVPSGAAGPVVWHPRLNQIFVGAGGRAGGGARILYDPDFSERGALVAVARAPRAKDASDLVPRLEPAYERPEKTGGGRKRQRDIVADRARVKHMPQGPAGTAGAGGRIGGGTGGTLLTQYLLKERGLLFNPTQEMDPREAVLRHSASSFLVDTACACTLLPVCVCVHVLTRTACLFPRVCAAQMRRRSRSASSRSRKRRRRKRSLAPSHREAGSK